MRPFPIYDEIAILADNFEQSYPHEILAWAAHRFGAGLAMATGFGPEGIVIMHILHEVSPTTTVFYLDTDLFFPETYALRDKLEERFGKKFERISTGLSLDQQNEQYGPELWSREPNHCCRLRKVEPLRAYLHTKLAWITAIRRDQTAHRFGAGLAMATGFGPEGIVIMHILHEVSPRPLSFIWIRTCFSPKPTPCAISSKNALEKSSSGFRPA